MDAKILQELEMALAAFTSVSSGHQMCMWCLCRGTVCMTNTKTGTRVHTL